MHGGIKIYAGAPSAARHYVEADRGRADDYYLTEGTGIARRYTATDGQVAELAALAGDGYEAWVAGLDPDTGEPRGRLRTDDRAVRFVEVVVNRSEEHTSELQSRQYLVCRLLLEKKKTALYRSAVQKQRAVD